MSNTLDLDLIEKEKRRLLNIVQSAVDGFVEATGLLPIITVEATKEETVNTRCGQFVLGKSKPIVTINITI